MAHRNRWFKRFTVLKNGGSFHGKLLVVTRWCPQAQPFELGSVSPRCQRLTQRRPWRPPCRPDVGPSEGPATQSTAEVIFWHDFSQFPMGISLTDQICVGLWGRSLWVFCVGSLGGFVGLGSWEGPTGVIQSSSVPWPNGHCATCFTGWWRLCLTDGSFILLVLNRRTSWVFKFYCSTTLW